MLEGFNCGENCSPVTTVTYKKYRSRPIINICRSAYDVIRESMTVRCTF